MKSFSTILWVIFFGFISMAGFREKKSLRANCIPAAIWTTELSADGKYFALGGDDSTVWIYQSSDYTLYKNFRLSSMVRGLSWHPGKNLLAVATINGVELLDPEIGKLNKIPHLKTGGRAIGWNHSGKFLALADNYGEIQLMDNHGNLLRTILKHNNNSYLTLDWHPQKNIMVTGSDEIMMFDITGKQLALIFHRDEPTAILSVKWHPSGTYFASGDYGHEKEGISTLLQFWSMDGAPIKTISGHYAEIRNLRWSGNGEMLATASDSLRLWSKDGMLLHSVHSDTNIWSLAWSKDYRNILTGCFENGDIQLYDVQAKHLRKL